MPTAIITLIISASIFFTAALVVWPTGTVETVEVKREFTEDQELWMSCYQLFDFYLAADEDSAAYQDAEIELVRQGCWP